MTTQEANYALVLDLTLETLNTCSSIAEAADHLIKKLDHIPQIDLQAAVRIVVDIMDEKEGTSDAC